MSNNTQWQRLALGALRAAFARFVTGESEKAHLEVERKFSLSDAEGSAIPSRVAELGFAPTGTATMTDAFLPAAVSGEMMRVRQERIDQNPGTTILTFKQWVATATGKERKESERVVRSSVGAVWMVIGRILSGRRLLAFSKVRQLFEGKLGDFDAVVSVDRVEGLGKYSGFYMEIEMLAPLDADVVVLRDRIFELASRILGDAREDVKRSYMDMLAEARQTTNG